MSKPHSIDMAALKAEVEAITRHTNGIFSRKETAERLLKRRIESAEKELFRLEAMLKTVKAIGI